MLIGPDDLVKDQGLIAVPFEGSARSGA